MMHNKTIVKSFLENTCIEIQGNKSCEDFDCKNCYINIALCAVEAEEKE